MSYRIYTARDGAVASGAEVTTVAGLSGPLAVVTVGEAGRGRTIARVRVELLPATLETWRERGRATIHHARVDMGAPGAPRLVECDTATPPDETAALVVFRTGIGFRGSNAHTGDAPEPPYPDWPGRDLAVGWIAQGDAGRMGGGEQRITLLPAGVVCRVARGGRLYGAPREHFYWFGGGGGELRVLTRELRSLEDFPCRPQ